MFLYVRIDILSSWPVILIIGPWYQKLFCELTLHYNKGQISLPIHLWLIWIKSSTYIVRERDLLECTTVIIILIHTNMWGVFSGLDKVTWTPLAFVLKSQQSWGLIKFYVHKMVGRKGQLWVCFSEYMKLHYENVKQNPMELRLSLLYIGPRLSGLDFQHYN